MQELEKDKDDYFKRHNITDAEQKKIDEMYKVNDQIDVSICKDEFANATRGASLHDENCPYWGQWHQGKPEFLPKTTFAIIGNPDDVDFESLMTIIMMQ